MFLCFYVFSIVSSFLSCLDVCIVVGMLLDSGTAVLHREISSLLKDPLWGRGHETSLHKGCHERPSVHRTIFVRLIGGEEPRRVGRHEFRDLLRRLAERFEDRSHRITATLVIREVGPEVGLHFALVVQGLLRFRAEAHVAVRLAERDTIATVLLEERGALFVVLLHEEAAFLGLDGDEVHDAHVVGGHCDCVAFVCVLQLFFGDGFLL